MQKGPSPTKLFPTNMPTLKRSNPPRGLPTNLLNKSPAAQTIVDLCGGLCIACCKRLAGFAPGGDLGWVYRAPLGKSTTPIVLKIMFISSRMDIFFM